MVTAPVPIDRCPHHEAWLEISGLLVLDCKCHTWTGKTSAGGTPVLRVNGSNMSVRRLARYFMYGEADAGIITAPMCNALCLHPNHLKDRPQHHATRQLDAITALCPGVKHARESWPLASDA